jgi:CHRD domain
MSRLALRLIALGAVVALLGVGSYAIAGGGSKQFRGIPLTGYEETPATLSTPGTGSFEAKLSNDGTRLEYKLSYSGLEGAVAQAHVHFGQRALSGGISFWLCQTTGTPAPAAIAAVTPFCPVPGGTVEDEITAAEVIGPAAQGIAPGEFAEILAAMRAGYAYANVHTSTRPTGEIRAQINDGDRGRHEGRDGRDDD